MKQRKMPADKIRRLRLAAYLLTLLAGIWLPASKIISHAFPLHEPSFYRFAATAPYDGGDPFRGRYVRLKFESLPFRQPAGQPAPNGRVCAALSRGADGMAVAAAVSKEPFKDRDYIRAEVDHTENSQNKIFCYLAPPENSCYLGNITSEERAALRRLFSSSGRKWTAVVKVYPDGGCETVWLEVNGKDIRDLMPYGK